MSRDKDNFRRRTVLKTTSATLAGAGILTTSVSASEDSSSDCTDCSDIETLAKNETHQIIKVDRDGETYTFQVDTEQGSAKQVEVDEPVDSATIDNEGEIGTLNHEGIIERSDYDVDDDGDCNGKIYDSHYSVIFTFETGKSLDDYPSGVLEAALCAVIGAAAGSAGGPYVGAALAALGAIVCYSFSYFFLDHINMSGKTGAIGGWDCHRGWLNEEGICYGATSSYTTDADDLTSAGKISGPHLSAGESVSDFL